MRSAEHSSNSLWPLGGQLRHASLSHEARRRTVKRTKSQFGVENRRFGAQGRTASIVRYQRLRKEWEYRSFHTIITLSRKSLPPARRLPGVRSDPTRSPSSKPRLIAGRRASPDGQPGECRRLHAAIAIYLHPVEQLTNALSASDAKAAFLKLPRSSTASSAQTRGRARQTG